MTLTLPIKGFENKYTISSSGEVYSLLSNKVLKCAPCTSGYPMAKLYVEGGGPSQKRVYKYIRVHRLVADHFLENTDNLPYVNHIDGNKSNPDVSNLEFCTAKDNSKHAFSTGLTPRKPRAVSSSQLEECRVAYAAGVSIKDLSSKLGVSRMAIERFLWDGVALDTQARKLHLSIRGKATGECLSVSVNQYSLDGVFIKKWDSMITAAKTLGIHQGNISNAVAGRSKSSGGFIWKK